MKQIFEPQKRLETTRVSHDEHMRIIAEDIGFQINSQTIKKVSVKQLKALAYIAHRDRLNHAYDIVRSEMWCRLEVLEEILGRVKELNE